MAALNPQAVPLYLESVNKRLPALFAMLESPLIKMFNNKSEEHQVSPWTVNSGGTTYLNGYRIPVQLSPGGDISYVNLDGGDLGTGSMLNTAYQSLGFFSTNLAGQVPLLSAMGSKSPNQAIRNVLKTQIDSMLREQKLYNEISFFGDGTGTLAQATAFTTVGGQTVYSLDSSFAANRLRGFNAMLDVWNSTLTTQRAANVRIASINRNASPQTVTLNLTVTGAAANDVLVFSQGAGATFTQWRQGLYSYMQINPTGSINMLPWATAYEIIPPNVNAAGSPLNPSLALALKSQVLQRRDDDQLSGMIGISHFAPRAGWYLQGFVISEWHRGPSDKMIDLVPGGNKIGDTYEMIDVQHYVSRYAQKDRSDWVTPSTWGVINLQPDAFVVTPDGNRFFVPVSTTSGNHLATFQFYVNSTQNRYCMDMARGGTIYGQQIPPGQ
jgi:hypothetical protein